MQIQDLSATEDKAWQTHIEFSSNQQINRLEMSAERVTFRSGLHSHPSRHQYLSPYKSLVLVVAAQCIPNSAELSRDCKPLTRSAHAVWPLHGVATMTAFVPQSEVSYIRTIKQRIAADT